jgi:F0F1-type ATP synthase alpha subunit
VATGQKRSAVGQLVKTVEDNDAVEYAIIATASDITS